MDEGVKADATGASGLAGAVADRAGYAGHLGERVAVVLSGVEP